MTNCFRGNEKGHVESSVKILRKYIFAGRYCFHTLEDAQEYLHDRLIEFNRASKIQEEWLLPLKPKLELAEINVNEVNSCSFICVDTLLKKPGPFAIHLL